ncbi:MAG: hypothetical protein ACUVRE_02645 [Thermoanaerobaculaceae bacterium]
MVKINPHGTDLIYETYLAGDVGLAILVDTSERVYVAGQARSREFPATLKAYDTTKNGHAFDAFVTKFWAAFVNAKSPALTKTNHGAICPAGDHVHRYQEQVTPS